MNTYIEKGKKCMKNYDVIVVGAGLAGLVATTELAQKGKRVLLLDQEGAQSLGGQAWWSFGGLFMVDTPEQRRMGITDSKALAWQDWLGTAGYDREDEDYWGKEWAKHYVDFATEEKRAWLHEKGVRFFPVVGWAERGGYLAEGHGNSVPRFHITWGTGPGLVEPFVNQLHYFIDLGFVTYLSRHRVESLLKTKEAVTGVAGSVLQNTKDKRRGGSNLRVIDENTDKTGTVIIDRGGSGSN